MIWYFDILLCVSWERNLLERKALSMKMGHVTGTKKERTAATPEFDRIQAEWLRKIEAELAAKQTAQVIPLAMTEDGYRDWEATIAGEQYLICNEDGDAGDWELRRLVDSGWQRDW